MTAAPLHRPGTVAELIRIVERQAADPDRAEVRYPAQPEEFARIAATWDQRDAA